MQMHNWILITYPPLCRLPQLGIKYLLPQGEKGGLFLLSRAHTTPTPPRPRLMVFVISLSSPYTSSPLLLVQTTLAVSLYWPSSSFLSIPSSKLTTDSQAREY